MKPKANRFFTSPCTLGLIASTVALHFGGIEQATAASQAWTGNSGTDANWSNAANWSGNAVPGIITITNGANTTDVATFNAPLNGTIGSSTNPVIIDVNRMIGSVLFDTANAGSYFIGATTGSPTLMVGNNLNITMSAAVTASQTFNAAVGVHLPSSTSGAFTIQNNSSSVGAVLTFAGGIVNSPNSTRGTAWTLGGSNTGENLISGVINISNTGGISSSITKVGVGTWVLSNANVIPGGVTINGGKLAVANNAALGTNGTANANNININNGGTLEVRTGVTLNNGLSLNLNNGGTLRAIGTAGTNGRINVNVAAATAVTLATAGSTDVFTIGNGANDLAGGSADSLIQVAGPGTFVLGQSSSYAGNWSINGGTVRVGNASALGAPTTVVNFGAASTGKLQLGGGNLVIGGLSSNANLGSPVVENGTSGSAMLTVGGAGATTYAGILQDGAAGTLALTKSGLGELNLTGANTFTGGSTISGGLLRVNNASGTSATGTGAISIDATGALGGGGFVSGAVTVNSGGILAPGDGVGTLTLGSLTLNAGAILNYEFKTGPAANDFVAVAAPGGLAIQGGGFNLYNEGTTNAFSTLGNYNLIGYSGALGGTGASALTVLNPQAGKNYAFDATGSAVVLQVTSAGVVSNWLPDADGSWNVAGNWSSAIPNGTGETANFTKTLTADRTVTLDGNKTLGGLVFDSGSSPLGYILAAGTGGNLSFDNGSNQANIIGTSGANTISADMVLVSTNTVAAIASGSSLDLSGSIGGTGNFVKSGAGSVDLSNSANSFAGNTSVSGGTLGFAALTSLGAGALIIDGGTLRYDAGNSADVSGKVVTFGAGGATIDTNGNDVTYANAIGNGGAGSFVKAGAGVLTLQGDNTFTGSRTVTGGSLIVTGSSATSGGTFLTGAGTLLAISSDSGLGAVPAAVTTNLTFDPGVGNTATLRTDAPLTTAANRRIAMTSGTAIFNTNGNNVSLNGALTGPGNLQKTGAGALTLAASSVGATGTTTVDQGTVLTSTPAGLPSGAITLNNDGAINFTANGTYSLTNITINGNNAITTTSNSGVFGLGALNFNSGTLTTSNAFVGDFTGPWTGTGTMVLSNGGYRLNGTAGSTSVGLDLGTGNAGLSVRNTATAIAFGSLAGGPGTVLSGSGGGATQAVTFNVGGNNASTTFFGEVRDGVGLTSLNKTGTGVLTMAGASTYSGATTVSAGTMLVNGTLGNTTVAVNGGTLGGNNGAIGSGFASVSVNAGGTLAPGSSIGTLTVNGAVNLNDGAVFAYELMGGGTTADLLDVNGALSINGATLSLSQLGGSYTPMQRFTLFAYETLGLGTGFVGLADGTQFTQAGGTWQINYADPAPGVNGGVGASYVTITAVPEPASAVLGMLGLLALLRRRR